MEIIIEPVKIDELEQLRQISRQTFYHTFSEQNSKEDMRLFLDTAYHAEVLKSEMLANHNYFFFAKIGNQVAGYLKLSAQVPEAPESEDVLEIARIYVVQEKLGSGVGKALLEFALSFAEKNNKMKVVLGVWEKNEKAIGFYKSFGFEKFGEQTFKLGNDAQTDWLMKKEMGN